MFGFVWIYYFIYSNVIFFFSTIDLRKIFPFELFHLGGDEVNTG